MIEIKPRLMASLLEGRAVYIRTPTPRAAGELVIVTTDRDEVVCEVCAASEGVDINGLYQPLVRVRRDR